MLEIFERIRHEESKTTVKITRTDCWYDYDAVSSGVRRF